MVLVAVWVDGLPTNGTHSSSRHQVVVSPPVPPSSLPLPEAGRARTRNHRRGLFDLRSGPSVDQSMRTWCSIACADRFRFRPWSSRRRALCDVVVERACWSADDWESKCCLNRGWGCTKYISQRLCHKARKG